MEATVRKSKGKSKKSKKFKVAVYGFGGKMGQEIAKLLEASQDLELTLGISPRSNNSTLIRSVRTLDSKDFQDIDVLVDFSRAEAFSDVLKFAIQQKLPFVSGTTGLSVKQKKELEQAGKKIPVLWSSNMSLGVAALSQALSALSVVSDFDFQIEEVHHTRKTDSPSGTALLLQQELEKAIGKKAPINAIRAGGVFGEHEIRAYGENETITFSHRAMNRKLFAEGAVAAISWILKKQNGIYGLKDLFKR